MFPGGTEAYGQSNTLISGHVKRIQCTYLHNDTVFTTDIKAAGLTTSTCKRYPVVTSIVGPALPALPRALTIPHQSLINYIIHILPFASPMLLPLASGGAWPIRTYIPSQ